MSNNKIDEIHSIDDSAEKNIIAYAAYNGIKDMITKSCTIVINVDAEGNADYEYIDNSVPTNPNTGDPYFEIRDDAWNGEWVAGEAKPIPDSEFGGDDGY